MPINTGFSDADQREYIGLLKTHHVIQMQVQLLTLDHTYVSDVSTKLLTGQVTIDNDADTTRALTIELLDPAYQLKLDQSAPDDGAVFFTRMVKVNYGVLRPDRSKGFYIPLFCGPIDDVTRTDAVVAITAKGKEALLSSNMWTSKTYKKNTRKTEVIKDLLKQGGETKYEIPNLGDKLGADWTVKKDTSPWVAAKALAKGMGYQLFYNGRGVCIMRKVPGSNNFTFGDKGMLLTEPQPKYSIADAINAVEVVGGVPKGAKTHVYFRIVAPSNHALSPWKLGRNGKARYLTKTVSDDNLKTVAKCAARARAELSNGLIEAVDVAFDALPAPHLEEADYCTVSNDGWSSSFRYNKATIPLSVGVSSVGYLKTVYKRTITTGGAGGGGKVVKVRKKKTKKKKGKKK